MDIDFFLDNLYFWSTIIIKKNEVLFQSVPCYVQTIAILV